MAAVGRRDFTAGFSFLAKMAPFPKIISRICDHPCQLACKRSDAGGSLQIHALEQACTEYADKKVSRVPLLPGKNKQVAIVGGGLSGLTAAYDLAIKGYGVTVYEASGRIGGRVLSFSEQQLPRELVDSDFSVLAAMGIEVRCDCQVKAGENVDMDMLCNSCDAIYVGCRVKEMELWQTEIDSVTQVTSRKKIFGGGGQEPYSPIGSISQGRVAAVSIDRFLQGASLTASREKSGAAATRLYTSMKGVECLQPELPLAEGGYTEGEAAREAGRCLQCQCLECVKVCEFLGHFGAYPKRYIREVYNNESIVMGIHHANKMINSCAVCGLCAQVCPNGLDMGEVFLDSRQAMAAKGKMPPSVHDFALRDLEFSISDHFALSRHQPGHSASKFIFFPGCQLAASMPDHVEKTYAYLRDKLEGGIGLMLGCCGAPAEWAGRMDLFQTSLQRMESDWRRLGEPRIIAACATCIKILRQHLPQIQIMSLWEAFVENGLPDETKNRQSQHLCIHDPCAARLDRKMQDQARSLLMKMGMTLEEPELTRKLTTCCSYGGLMSQANPELAKQVVQKRIQASSAKFVVYCAMCRDNFAAEGKPTLHILDLIWGDEAAADRTAPDCSTRRENRARLKTRLLRELWGEKMTENQAPVQVEISPELRETMQKRMILAEDVEQAIGHAEATGEKLLDPETGRIVAHYRPACVTYWVEYSRQESGFVLQNAYSHRMLVVEEAGL